MSELSKCHELVVLRVNHSHSASCQDTSNHQFPSCCHMKVPDLLPLVVPSAVMNFLLELLTTGKGRHNTITSVMRSETTKARVKYFESAQYAKSCCTLAQMAETCVPQLNIVAKTKPMVHIITIAIVILVAQSNNVPRAETKMRR